MLTRASIGVAAASLAALCLATSASAGLATLKASCKTLDAADGNPANGLQLPYVFCDDGVPAAGGRTANEGAVSAVAVPERYGGDGYTGLPPKTTPDANAGADTNGDIALDVDVSMPDPARFPPPPGGYPLVVMMHGCCSGNKQSWEASTIDAPGESWHYNNAWFAARGYVVLTYTARGFVDQNGHGSTGETQIDSRRYEMNDYQYLAGALADDPFFHVDGQRVVTTGGSYGGGFSWLALTDPTWTSPGGRPMRLAATAPRYGWTDLVYSLVPTGLDRRDALPPTDGSASTTPPGMAKRSIVAGLFGTGSASPNHTTFTPEIAQSFACLQAPVPESSNPLCQQTLSQTLPAFIDDRSAYYQNAFFDRIKTDATARVPVFSAGTLTDELFTEIEHRRMVDRLKSVVPGYPVEEYYGDYEHFTQNKAKEWGDVCGSDHHVCNYRDSGGDLNAPPPGLRRTGVTTMLNRFIDHYAAPRGDAAQPTPPFDVTASLQICPQNASAAYPLDEPGERFTAPTFGQLAPNDLRIAIKGSQTTTNQVSPNTHGAHADPIANQETNASHCPVETPSDPAGPGVASYESDPLARDYTTIGQTRVTVPHTGTGSDLQLDARMYDVYPDGTAVFVQRGPRRLTSADETTVWDLQGNGWHFPKGHRILVELTQDDEPYVKSSSVPSTLTLAGVTLDLPVREGSATIGGGPAPRQHKHTRRGRRGRHSVPRLSVAVSPRSAALDRRTVFRFRVTAVVHGKRRAVAGALVHFADHVVRTDKHGRARLTIVLRRRHRYHATATKRGFRRGGKSVRIAARRARFDG